MSDQVEQFERLVRGKQPGIPKTFLVVIGLLAFFALFSAAMRPYTDWLWFANDVQKPQVFLTTIRMRAILFLIAFVPTALLLFHTVRRSLAGSRVYLRAPESFGEKVVANILTWIEKKAFLASLLFGIIGGTIAAFGLSAQWRLWALASNAQPFNVNDPLFGRDLAYFVFVWPWHTAILNYAFSVVFLCLLVALGIYIGLQALAALAKIELGRPAIRRHLAWLGATATLLLGGKTALGVYGYGLAPGGQFTGAGYADITRMNAQIVVAVMLVGLAVVIAWNGYRFKPFKPTLWGAALVFLVYIVGCGMVPSIVQRVYVGPNYLNVEGPFARRAIEATRFAYGLDRIEVRDFNVQDRPTPDEIARFQPTLDNMRLWDPTVLQKSVEGLQGLRRYYRFHDIDIDRYTLDGEQRIVMLGARDIDIDGLDRNARNWVNQRLQYTHGMGVAMTPVNQAEPSGRPRFIVRNLPPTSPPELPIDQPRIYFSDFRGPFNELRDDYAIVGTKEDEFDYPSEDETRVYRWTANRGVPLGAPFARMAFAARFSDQNILISPNITRESRILFRRNVIERASLVYPFLQFDRDPYIVIFNGRLVWILDGYTLSGTVPYSARIEQGRRAINYIRNPVKVVVDAYTGETNAYAIDPEEPILRAWRQVYPGLVLDADQIPEGLNRHFRYPEDMFMLQSVQLTQYHVTEPTQFLNNEDAWEIPVERGRTGGGVPMKAYWVQIQLPDEDTSGFMLILPFTPREKPNMSGWMAAHCDPEHYGRLLLYKFPKGTVIQGPAQMESIFDQDREIADINRQFNNEQSQIVPGNLLVIPIGRSVLYVKPLFLQSRSAGITPIPELKKVILALSDRVVVADTYEEALDKLFGGETRRPTPPAERPDVVRDDPVSDPIEGVSREELRQAVRLLDQAEAALRAGDFGQYGDLMRQARERLRELSR